MDFKYSVVSLLPTSAATCPVLFFSDIEIKFSFKMNSAISFLFDLAAA